jgi:hypothetical protein
MKKFKLLVQSNPVTGKETEYNNWYSNQHLGEVIETPGFVSAQRFTFAANMGGENKHKYLAIYNVEAESAEAALKSLVDQSSGGAIFISDTLDLAGVSVTLFEELTPEVSRSKP